MKHNNFLAGKLEDLVHCHDGKGTLQNFEVFSNADFASGLRFMNYTVLPSGTSIGEHTHGNDEEVYIILQGKGSMYLNGTRHDAISGCVFVNEAFGTHALINDGEDDMKILVFEVALGEM